MLAAAQTPQDVALLLETIGRDDEIDVPPDRLGGAVAEDARGAGVPARDHAVERLADDGVVGGLDDRREERTSLLGAPSVRDVAREALGVDEPPLLPQHARVDQDRLQRAVLAPHLRRILEQPLAAAQAVQDVGEDGLIGVELADVVTDVLVARVAERLQLRVVRPQDDPVRADAVQADGRRVDERRQLGGLPAHLHLAGETRVLVRAYPRRRPPEQRGEQRRLDQGR